MCCSKHYSRPAEARSFECKELPIQKLFTLKPCFSFVTRDKDEVRVGINLSPISRDFLTKSSKSY